MSARIVLVTGTGTDVGKTIVTAALATALRSRGRRVAVVKPAQTGVRPDEPGDLAEVIRLAGPLPTHEGVRLPDPLAPDAAARLVGHALPTIADHADVVETAAADVDVVLVEGSGGLLVRLDATGGTLANLGSELAGRGSEAGFVVVVAAGLGTLNHAALTAEALATRGLSAYGLVIGAWPAEPDLAARCNLADLPAVTGLPLLGRIPAGAGSLGPDAFRSAAPRWIEDESLR